MRSGGLLMVECGCEGCVRRVYDNCLYLTTCIVRKHGAGKEANERMQGMICRACKFNMEERIYRTHCGD